MAVTVAVGIAPAGCQSPPASSVSAPLSQQVEVRRSQLDAPAGYNVQTVEFADASHGFAELVTRQPVATDRYGSALFSTVDGGLTWHPLADPRQPSSSPQLYTVDNRTVVLLAEPYGWYVSIDAGASFERRPSDPAPSELDALDALGAGSHPLACEPACDPPPAHPGGSPYRVEVSASPDGHDVWLVGYLSSAGAGVGSVAPSRRKDVGVPLLWLRVGGRWVPKGVIGAPTPTLDVYSVTPIGGGLAAVAGSHASFFLVDAAWHPVDLSPRPEWVSTLRDGTVFAIAPTNRTYYLGTRTGSTVRWVQVALDTP
jgi:hypothetical protein